MKNPNPKPPEMINPELLEYLPLGSDEKWRVEQWRELTAEFPVSPEQMPMFHETASSQPRLWEFCRRLFGINPLLLAEGGDLEDFTVQTRRELCAARGVEAKQLQAELDTLRGLWGQVNRTETEEARGDARPTTEARGDARPTEARGDARPTTLLDEMDREVQVLRECGFNEKIFMGVQIFDPLADPKLNPSQLVSRPREKNLEERAWFVARCEDSRKMLKEPMARTIVRDMLLNELHINRLQDQLALLPEGTRDFDRFDKRKADLQARFEAQLDRLQEMFPDLNVAQRISFRQCISTLNQGERDFYGDGNNVRRDGLFTAAEIEVLLRQSVQNPQPQYRLSLPLLVAEAVHGLYDRNFRSALAKKPGLLKKIDASVKAGINAAREAQAQPLVDLEDGVTPDEGSQHEDLVEL